MTFTIVEVGARDGLQNEQAPLTPKIRANLIEQLSAAGIQNIEAGAFVSPKWVPQMANTNTVLEILAHNKKISPQTTLSVLTPNMKGFELALQSNIKEIAIFTAASNSFTKKNINASIQQSLQQFKGICQEAQRHNIRVRGYVSCVIHCPYEGFINANQVTPVVQELFKLGCYEVSLGETTGRATPQHIRTLLKTLRQDVPQQQLAAHFHDTYGQGLANILAALDFDITTFDSSIGGLGGCPYSPGASGNLATEDLVYMLQGLGELAHLDLQALAHTGNWISKQLHKSHHSKTGAAIMSSPP